MATPTSQATYCSGKGLRFVPFLPEDNDPGRASLPADGAAAGAGHAGVAADVDPEASRQSVSINNQAVGLLLKLPFPLFVSVMAFDGTAKAFFDSFLKHRRRRYENPSRESDEVRQ